MGRTERQPSCQPLIFALMYSLGNIPFIPLAMFPIFAQVYFLWQDSLPALAWDMLSSGLLPTIHTYGVSPSVDVP